MAEIATTFSTVSAAPVLSLRATTSARIKDLAIKNGQLIFVHDAGKIVFDYNGKRTFYNQIFELATDEDRLNLEEPINGKYYFVISTAIFWRYDNGWVQLTKEPEEILFIGVDFPELGQANKLYIHKENGISIWDDENKEYVLVANKNVNMEEISELDIDSLLFI